jgi:hypothetical protein
VGVSLLTLLEGGPRVDVTALLLRWSSLLIAARALPDDLLAATLLALLLPTAALRMLHSARDASDAARWARRGTGTLLLLLTALALLIAPGTAATRLWLYGFALAAVLDHITDLEVGDAAGRRARGAGVELAAVLGAGSLLGLWWMWPLLRVGAAFVAFQAAGTPAAPSRERIRSLGLGAPSAASTGGLLLLARHADLLLLTALGQTTAAVLCVLGRRLIELLAAALALAPRGRARLAAPVRTLVRASFGGLAAVVVVTAAPVLGRRWFGPQGDLFVEVVTALALALAVHAAAAPAWRYLLARDKRLTLALLRLGAALAIIGGVTVALIAGVTAMHAALVGSLCGWAALAFGGRLAAALVERAPRSPLAYVVATTGYGRRWWNKRFDTIVSDEVDALARHPAVRAIEIVGSARHADTMVVGASDVDLLVTVDHVEGGHDHPIIDRRADRGGALVDVHRTVVSAPVLRALRRTGHSVFLPRWSDIAHGLRAPTRPVPIHKREGDLTHAIAFVLRLQRVAIEDCREDGAVRSERVAKRFRLLLDKLGPSPEAVLRRWRGRGLGVPSDLLGTPPARRWLDREDVACLLTIALAELDEALRPVSADWPLVAAPPVAPAWTTQLARSVRPRLAPLLGGAGPRFAVELTPTGPTTTDPMLLATWSPGRGPTLEEVQHLLDVERRADPLPAAFRHYPHVCLLPPAALASDVFFEHAPLVAASRRAHRLPLSNLLPVRQAPSDMVRRAAARATTHALWVLSELLPRLARGAPVPRVPTLLQARLPALRLWLDEGDAPAAPREVIAAYRARYDDALAPLLDAPAPAPSALAEALDAWAYERLHTLHQHLDDEERAQAARERAS